MSEPTEGQKPSAKRGEAAWREARDKVAERNASARKAGKEVRAAKEREQAEARRAMELRELIAVRSSRKG